MAARSALGVQAEFREWIAPAAQPPFVVLPNGHRRSARSKSEKSPRKVVPAPASSRDEASFQAKHLKFRDLIYI